MLGISFAATGSLPSSLCEWRDGLDELCGAKCEPKQWCSVHHGDEAACVNSYVQRVTGGYGRCVFNGGKCTLGEGDEECPSPSPSLPPPLPPPPLPTPPPAPPAGTAPPHCSGGESIRELPEPKWCGDYTAAGKEVCESKVINCLLYTSPSPRDS